MALSSASEIRLKLLPENNVIYAKCSGFETEVFMPVIINDRISIINVIPSRRCKCITTTHIVAKSRKSPKSTKSPNTTFTSWRLSTSTSIAQMRKDSTDSADSLNRPLAESTPTLLKSTILRNCKMKANATAASIPTPQQVRRAVDMNTTFTELPMAKVPRTPLENRCSNVRIIKNVIIKPTIRQKPDAFEGNDGQNHQANLSEIEWPQAAINMGIPSGLTVMRKSISAPQRARRALILSSPTDRKNTPLQSNCSQENYTIREEARRNVRNELSMLPINSPPIPSWRKVITPERTYSHYRHTPMRTQKSTISSLIPNQTEAPKPEKCAIMKRIRTIVDKKTFISPRSFKHQLSSSERAAKEELRKEYRSRLRELTKKTAFDLFTTPGMKSKSMAKKLQQQFRQRCVNKGTSTFPKYKRLCTLYDEPKPAMPEPRDY